MTDPSTPTTWGAEPYPPVSSLPTYGAPTPPRRSPLVPLLIIGGVVGFVMVVIVGLVVVGSLMGDGSRSAEDTAVAWVEAFADDDPRDAYGLVVPAQRERLPFEVFECAFREWDQTEADVDVSVVDVDGNLVNTVWGDGAREYQVTEVVVRTTSEDGSFDEGTYDVVADGDGHYIRLSSRTAARLGVPESGVSPGTAPPCE